MHTHSSQMLISLFKSTFIKNQIFEFEIFFEESKNNLENCNFCLRNIHKL